MAGQDVQYQHDTLKQNIKSISHYWIIIFALYQHLSTRLPSVHCDATIKLILSARQEFGQY